MSFHGTRVDDLPRIEPISEGLSFNEIYINPAKNIAEVRPFNDLKDLFDSEICKEFQNFIINHVADWKYPTEFHPKECLHPVEGRVPFNLDIGDYTERLSAVAKRIMQYLARHVFLSGWHDTELITAFAIGTFFTPMFEYAPRLLIRGPTNSGKSTLLDILSEICYRGNLSGDTTEASLFRMIHNCGVTPLLDEFQDYDVSAQNGIKKVLKNGNVRGHSVQRTEKLGNNLAEARTYQVFGPVAFINQAGGRVIPEEVINRSISVMMMSVPNASIPMIPDRAELEEIRNELYTIRCLWLANRERVGFDEIYEQSIEELQSPKGIVCDSAVLHFNNRCRDILGTMYTIGKMMKAEIPILRAFVEIQDDLTDNERDTDLARAFQSMINIIERRMSETPVYTQPIDTLGEVSTFDIAREYEILLTADGDLNSNGKVSTRTVTNMIKDMGFKFDRDRYTNHSLISRKRFDIIFQTNLGRYGTEESIRKYGKASLTTNNDGSDDSVVRSMCQDAESPNNLTRIGEDKE